MTLSALYIHIPFCSSKCDYCDFASFSGYSVDLHKKYINTVIKELSHRSKLFSSTFIRSIYFGGGTPSIINHQLIGDLINSINMSFNLDSNVEITIEANPKSLSVEKLESYRKYGINRISMGVQSYNNHHLQAIGRESNGKLGMLWPEIVRLFSNISVDLMYGLPSQTIADVQEDIDTIPGEVSHVSFYGLTLEEGTPLHKRTISSEADQDMQAEMMILIKKNLAQRGYAQYEISNYAKTDKRSVHNINYWDGGDYLGIGSSAVSTIDGVRRTNAPAISDYIEGKYEEEHLNSLEKEFEMIMLGFRMLRGLNLREYESKTGYNFVDRHKKGLDEFRSLVSIDGQFAKLTEQGVLLYNEILTGFLI
jgi:oxygen-independent coproporphyrinogen III oxidase